MSQSVETYEVRLNELIESESDKYEVLEFFGRGAFGQVVKCLKRSSDELVALKILKNSQWSEEQGQNEMKILALINQEDTERFRFVRTVEFFTHKNHLCLAFEMLAQDLSDFLLDTSLPAKHVSYILKQIIIGLSKLKELGVIHSDLKPENIMVENRTAPPYRIKIIDFGNALKSDEAECGDIIQTLPYRAPEVLLGLPYDEQVDMWSLGCIAAELFLKWPLYPGSNEFDQIWLITQLQGLPPPQMVSNRSKALSFFSLNEDGDWTLKSKSDYEEETGESCCYNCIYLLDCLEDISEMNVPSHLHGKDLRVEISDRKLIIDLIKKMLELNPTNRITPLDALLHPAIVEL